MSSEQMLAEDARQVLNNRAYKEAYSRMAEALEAKALGCDVDNKEQTQRVVLAKQILAGLRREFDRMIMDGQVSEIQLNELNQRKKTIFRR